MMTKNSKEENKIKNTFSKNWGIILFLTLEEEKKLGAP
ncbi:hypothetical protein Pmgp_03695 [Pelotomaculum propionicicum]|uniref:Uncharacterized protein n=1 Tax=Pelotomaculum propionicicum TaxID=258475 RepID=A0A4Y7RIP0_9FIRM|nr:hypothetical protein Pmgp_03695 [Pelotomaculum propionicicum]